MQRSRGLAAVAVTAVAVMLVAACSSNSKTTNTGPNSNSSTASAANIKGQHLEVIAEWSGAEQAAFQAVLKGFETKTGATVTYTSGGDNTSVLVNTRLAGGDPPDVALIAQPGAVVALAAKNQIYPLTGDALTATQADFSPAWQQLGTLNGKLYGVFFKAANKSVVWYNASDFTNAGVQPPTTWDQFIAASKALSDSGVPAMAIPAGDGWPATDWFENIYLRTAGVANYNKLTQHQIPWTDPTVITALTTWKQYLTTPGAVLSGAANESFTQSEADVFGVKPKAAMLYEGDFVGTDITALGKFKVGSTAKFFNFPSINGSPQAVVSGGDEAVALKNTPAATELMAYLASPDAAAIWAAKGGFLSANTKLALTTYPDDTTRSLAQALTTSQSVVFDMSDQTPTAFGGQTGASEWVILTKFVGNPSNPQATAAALEAAAVKDYK
jgi:alpha-glucoside transport system substrate-binding protein